MIGARLLERLHGAALRVQFPVVLALVPVTVAIHGLAVVPIATEIALDTGGVATHERPRIAAIISAALLIASVVVATLAAALLLRGSIRTIVEELCAATDAIARGDFRHRCGTRRRDELGQLAASIDVMAERLERLEQARRRTLACVSHELRTPLTIIQGYAFTLARGEADVVRRDRLELVQLEAARLAELIGDLIEAASLHAGGVRIRPHDCDVGRLVDGEVQRFTEAAAQRDLQLEVRSPNFAVRAPVDPGRISQVVANLLSNAVRHATPGTIVHVHVDRRGRDEVGVVVENACEPIPADIVERAFEPFVQGNARTGSVGLGLAIVHAIVAAHGGRVELDPDLAAAGRARVRVDLPSCGGSRSERAVRRRSDRDRRPSLPAVAIER